MSLGGVSVSQFIRMLNDCNVSFLVCGLNPTTYSHPEELEQAELTIVHPLHGRRANLWRQGYRRAEHFLLDRAEKNPAPYSTRPIFRETVYDDYKRRKIESDRLFIDDVGKIFVGTDPRGVQIAQPGIQMVTPERLSIHLIKWISRDVDFGCAPHETFHLGQDF